MASVEAIFFNGILWNLVRMFNWIVLRSDLKLGHVGSKTRSQSKHAFWHLENIFFNVTSWNLVRIFNFVISLYKFDIWSSWVTRSHFTKSLCHLLIQKYNFMTHFYWQALNILLRALRKVKRTVLPTALVICYHYYCLQCQQINLLFVFIISSIIYQSRSWLPSVLYST